MKNVLCMFKQLCACVFALVTILILLELVASDEDEDDDYDYVEDNLRQHIGCVERAITSVCERI